MEVLDEPDAKRLLADIEAEAEARHRSRLQMARQRLQKGKTVFQHKVFYVAAGSIMANDRSDEVFTVYELEEAGLEGWQIIGVIPRRNRLLVSSMDEHVVGVYFVLQRELGPEEVTELD